MRGYTLVELVVSVALASIILVTIARFMGTSLSQYRATALEILADETARVQLKRIAHEVREARLSDTGAYPIVEASPQRFIFYANVDADVLTERVRYELIGTNLVRGITKPSGNPLIYNVGQEVVSTVANSIRNGATQVFTYYGKDYPADQTPITPLAP